MKERVGDEKLIVISVAVYGDWRIVCAKVKKGKVFPHSLPSVGPGADPGVQEVSPQVT